MVIRITAVYQLFTSSSAIIFSSSSSSSFLPEAAMTGGVDDGRGPSEVDGRLSLTGGVWDWVGTSASSLFSIFSNFYKNKICMKEQPNKHLQAQQDMKHKKY